MSTAELPQTSNGKYKVIGTRPIRHDGVDKVTGRAQYGADLRLQGTLRGAILRSPHAHAKIRSIDTSAAATLTIRSIVAVVTVTSPASSGPPAIDTESVMESSPRVSVMVRPATLSAKVISWKWCLFLKVKEQRFVYPPKSDVRLIAVFVLPASRVFLET